jgi:hypothetical protein
MAFVISRKEMGKVPFVVMASADPRALLLMSEIIASMTVSMSIHTGMGIDLLACKPIAVLTKPGQTAFTRAFLWCLSARVNWRTSSN